MTKKKVIFVGSFQKQSQSGHVGGQMFACNTLLNSRISEKVEWILIDSTARTNKNRMILFRLFGAIRRILIFIFFLSTKNPQSVLIFCSSGWSFIEKGLMARIAKIFRKKVILAPRSGLIKGEIESSQRFKKYVERTLNYVDILLCQGPSWKKYYRTISLNPNIKYEVIHNWIGLDEYLSIERKLADKNSLTILFMGWITSNKGIWDILKLVEKLADLPVRFLMAGDGDEFKAFQKAIVEKGLKDRIKLLGWIKGEKKFALLKEADMFLLPSYQEGYPNAILEAMASGLPTISTKTGAIPDIIINRENGFLVSPGDVDKMAIIIKEMLRFPEKLKYLSNQARISVKKNNTIGNAVQRFEEILG